MQNKSLFYSKWTSVLLVVIEFIFMYNYCTPCLAFSTVYYNSRPDKVRRSLRSHVPGTTTNGEIQRNKDLKQQWITCSSSKELAHAIRCHVKDGDSVAELGSQLREVSTLICDSIESYGKAVLVDTIRKFPKDVQESRTQAMRRSGDEINFYTDRAEFVEINSLDDWRQALFSRNATLRLRLKNNIPFYDVFVLDVNAIVGNDLEWTTLSIVREFLAMNGGFCRVVLIKSLSLNQWASRLIHGQRWCRNQEQQVALLEQQRKQNREEYEVTAASNNCKVVTTVGVPEYRQTIPYTVRQGDAVLEIGCHLGTSTTLIHSAVNISNNHTGETGYCIGVDIGTKIIRGAQKRHPDIFFAVGDAWRTAALLRTQQNFLQAARHGSRKLNPRTGFDVVYVDIGGLSGQDGIIESLALISAISNGLEPRCIVIKSLCMRRLSSTLIPYWTLQKQ